MRLLESIAIRHEYWWDGSNLHFADGDNTADHEMIAEEAFRYWICEMLDIEQSSPWDIRAEEFYGSVLPHFFDSQNYGKSDEKVWERLLRWTKEFHPDKEQMVHAACYGNEFEYLMKIGWIKINAGTFHTFHLARKDLINVSNALSEVLEEEGCEEDDELEAVSIIPVSTGKIYTIPGQKLLDKDFSSLSLTPTPTGPSNVAQGLDRENNLPCYGKNLGD